MTRLLALVLRALDILGLRDLGCATDAVGVLLVAVAVDGLVLLLVALAEERLPDGIDGDFVVEVVAVLAMLLCEALTTVSAAGLVS